ncbi:MAG: hypothetical protein J5685_12855 [Clostridiales bacterium]|nr:hypothetical protein [Clostridiales bacterium]
MKTVIRIISAVIGIAAIILIVISMRTGETFPYLAIALGLTGITNIINCRFIKNGYNGKNINPSEE